VPDESWAPVVRGMRLNAVELSQARTVENEIVASSLGEPNLTAALAERPVLPDSVRLRVREDLTDEDRTALDVLDDRVRFPGSWVLWQRVDSLVGQGPEARVFVLEPASGRLRFGDGRTGKIPPAGRDGIRCFSYQQGGDDAGNLPAWTPARLTSAVEGVDSVVLPIDTAGGYDAPATATLFATAPARLRHAGQAMSPADIEALAVTASGDVVRAHCARPAGPRRPIRIAIVVRGPSRRPVPTLSQRDTVAAFVREHGWGGLTEDAVEVGPPDWLPVAVSAGLVAPRDRLAEVEAAAKAALLQLFDPVSGGPDGTGWPFGRRPVVTDLLRTLDGIAGLERVVATGITAIGARPLDRLPADGLVCADATDITVTVTAKEAGG
jgi:predicted phage baseplate assembly protein